MMDRQSIKEILQSRFGFSDFRPPQEAVVKSLLGGRSALVIMPTGGGKSLCYQLPSQILAGLTLVISPLIALMKDQVDALQKKGIKATYINSSLSPQERKSRYQLLAQEKFDIVYVTPERFRKSEFRQALQANTVSLLAVDEAHCISQWGHDFRPDYTRLKEIRELLGLPPTIALTATATPEVQKDILLQLGLEPTDVDPFIEGVERPNLHLAVESVHGWDEKVRAIVGLRHLYPGPTIIYLSLVQSAQQAASSLRSVGLKPMVYHGQLPQAQRKRMQEVFLSGKEDLIIATPAFGLGVDKPDIRLIVHAETPGSLESYYQEVGRAGRDGQPAHCTLLFDPDDVSIQMDFIKWASPDPGFIRQVYRLIEKNPDRFKMEGIEYLTAQLNFYNRRDFRVETSLRLMERWGSVERTGDGPTDWAVREEPPEEYLDEKTYEARLRRQNEKLLEMVQYARQDSCRMQTILHYFGVDSDPCQHCDHCGGF